MMVAFHGCGDRITLILRATKGSESSSAELLLTHSGCIFEKVENPQASQPILYAPEGSFRGLAGVEIYVSLKRAGSSA